MKIQTTCPACGINKKFPHVAIVETDEKEEFNLYRCSKCGLLFVYPIPAVQRFFQGELTRKAPFSESRKKRMRKYFRKALKEYEPYLPPGARILDFACGYGHFLQVATEAGYDCKGVDISPVAREYISEHSPNITVYAQLEEIPTYTEKYDLVTAFEILYYTLSPREILHKLKKLLRPGGRIAVALSANRGWLIWLLSRIKRSPVNLKKGDWISSALLNSRAYYAFSTNSLIRLLASAGFTDIRTIRLRPPAPEKIRYRIPLFIWLVSIYILRVLTLGKVDLDTKAHVIGRYAPETKPGENFAELVARH
jgi:2-polyprenyl-3-methyl-5-hydroxy-6-metoxy-1,4-benzoquinol methylase